MVSTFKKVDGSAVTLSDFAFSEVQNHTANKIIFLSPTGAQLKTNGTDYVAFYYVHPDWCTAARSTWQPGWYWATINNAAPKPADYQQGSESKYWAGDFPIPYGTQFGVYRTGTLNATLTFNGQVAGADQEISAPNAKGRTWTGNIMPKDYKMKDFQFAEVQNHTANKIIFMSSTGAQLKDGSDYVAFYYVHPDWCTAARSTWQPGWYWATKDGVAPKPADYQQGSSSKFWAGEYDIPAGQGFGIYRTGTLPATLIIPTPIE